MAEQLGALGEVVPDRTLVLHVIRGLNERFKNIGMHIRRGRPFPTFLEAKADLHLEEMTMDPQTPSQAMALAASGSTPTAPSQSVRPGGTDSEGAPTSSSSKSRRSKHGGSGQQQHGGQPSSGQPAGQKTGYGGAPWPSYYNPWTGSIQMWPGTRPPLAALPPRPHQ